MKKTQIVMTVIVFATLIISSCSKQEIDIMTDENISYSKHIEPIVYNHCQSCHSGSYPSANLSLDTYEQVKDATENGKLLSRINDRSAPMPQSGLMSESKRAAFSKWAKNGYLK